MPLEFSDYSANNECKATWVQLDTILIDLDKYSADTGTQ